MRLARYALIEFDVLNRDTCWWRVSYSFGAEKKLKWPKIIADDVLYSVERNHIFLKSIGVFMSSDPV